MGDTVEAYNPTTGHTEPQAVQHVWINYDHDLVDVTLHNDGAPSRDAAADKTQRAAVKAHGSQAPPSDETIHTTAKHPWLTADRGWVLAGELRVGEAVVTLAGSTATVAAVRVRAGAADYYNLTVAQDHTYAVGDAHAVVHNSSPECGGTTPIGPSDARGGVYQLRDPETGQIRRTGKTNDLSTRRSDHARTYPGLDFEVVYRTDNPTEQMALEQILYDAHPEADITQGGLNVNRPIDPKKAIRFPEWYERTMQAGANFLERYGSGG